VFFAAVTVAAAAALSASLSGCGGAGTAGPTAPAGRADAAIEMITAGQDSFYLTMECGAAVEARRLGVHLTVAGPAHNTAADQLPLVQGVIVGNPDALIISPAADAASSSLTSAGPGGGGSLTQALYVAQENETKVVFADTSVAEADIGASRITADNGDGGRVAADSLGGTLGGKGAVAVLTAPGTGTPGAARVAAFRDEMKERYPGITVLAAQPAPADTPAQAARLVTADLKAHKDLAAVLALTQNGTQGAITALGAAQETGRVKLATFDASPFQMTGLVTGTIQLAVAQEPGVEGADAVDQAVNAIAGRKVVPAMSTPMVAIMPKNMNDPAVKRYIYDGTCTASLRGRMASDDD
jgi:ribose transport system substrate-binding protein